MSWITTMAHTLSSPEKVSWNVCVVGITVEIIPTEILHIRKIKEFIFFVQRKEQYTSCHCNIICHMSEKDILTTPNFFSSLHLQILNVSKYKHAL